ncbi:MAG: putative DNA binding domain-containing protein [Ruminococcus sp.]|nr:putative DNA binding domain-containing protein [Ruminococcus sp.]
MYEQDLKKLIEKIKNAKAEFQTVEVKRSQNGVTEKLYDTLSSFSNQDDGGVIVFGIYEKNDFEITGVNDVQLLQKRVMEQCEQMEPAVRAVFTVAEIGGRNVVAAEIPPVDITERPCFYKGKGRIKGSYIRVGDADMPMSEYEVYSYEAYRKKYQDEIRPVERAAMSSLDENKLSEYLLKLKRNKANLSKLEDEKIFELMSVQKEDKPTLAAQMLFGLYPQAYFPQLGIIAVSVPGTEIGETDIDGSRFIDNQRLEGTIPEMLDRALAFVRKNTRTKTIIDPDTGKRRDRSDYPVNSVREAVLNALVHRDYSIHTEGMPIQLRIFADRLEITNPGGLYGRLSIDTLGKIQPDTRNPVIATALEVLNVTENRYSGIPTILRECKAHGLPDPEFVNLRGEFTVIFRLQESVPDAAGNDRTAQLLEYCKTPRSRKEIADFLGLSSVTYAIKTYVQPLIDSGKIGLTEKKASSQKQRYFAK